MAERKGELKKDYRETLDYLFGLQRFGIKLGLANITALLRHMGDPHAGLPAVHIAGSNGKGSTAAFLASVLRQAGLRVGLYTSPHLVDFSERIQVEGMAISTERVVQYTEYIRKVVEKLIQNGELDLSPNSQSFPKGIDPEKATITFFEFTTAMAFLHFREEGVKMAVLETGLGGRLDATNVIDPLLSLITPISLEHQQYLGKTLLKIASEKAGIIKPKRPLLTSARQPRVIALFRQRCRDLGSPFYVWGEDFKVKKQANQIIDFQGRSHCWAGLRLGLAGNHQVVNASLALAAVEALMESGFIIKEAQVREGIGQARWPGRLELIGENPRVLLDGAHNPEATRVLKKVLRKDFPRRRLILVMGIMADKDIPQMMANLAPLADLLILTRPKMDRAASLDLLREQAAPFKEPAAEIDDVGQALDHALSLANHEDLVLVSGSLFTVGEARAHLVKKGMVLS
ncbi:MAG: folylpolyglutamate synthase/dihydrofolate synthase family protein [Thermodesulfobacteriota bacterium]|nr:folylpolyglutamate synthase/dihydrofolate synthase family protein [Thermodesulfobacteriota bacterium]